MPLDDDTDTLTPQENVYSYFTFSRPIRKGSSTAISHDLLAWTLVVLNIVLQGTILYAIFHSIVDGKSEWRTRVIAPDGECNPGGSLCTFKNNTYSCAPPSVELAGRWEELDLNNDGIWDVKEVETARESIRCKYHVDIKEVFHVFISFVKHHENQLPYLHPLVKDRQGLHKSYFDFAKGDIIMCTYGYEALCPSLLYRGFFDGALQTGVSKRVGTTINSALKFCNELLREGGVCDQSLPSAYGVWQKTSEMECQDPSWKEIVYKHPTTGVTKSMLGVDYKAVSDWEGASHSPMFLIYKTMIIMLWILCLFPEFKLVFMVFMWALTMPGDGDVEEPVKEERDSEGNVQTYVIQGISKGHRLMVFCMSTVRLIFAGTLGGVGVTFLIEETSYIDLLLNALGLAFVLEISNALYAQVLCDDLKNQFMSVQPFQVPVGMFWKFLRIQDTAMRDLCGLLFIIILVVLSMCLHNMYVAGPMAKALECTCLTYGEQCREASLFNKDFWSNYWSQEIPAVFASIEKMKKETQGGNQTSSLEFPSVNQGSTSARVGIPGVNRTVFAEMQHHAPKECDVVPNSEDARRKVVAVEAEGYMADLEVDANKTKVEGAQTKMGRFKKGRRPLSMSMGRSKALADTLRIMPD